MLVAIVDDDGDDRLALQDTLDEAEYTTIVREAPISDTSELMSWLSDVGADAIGCDHFLSGSDYAGFHGAEAMSLIYREMKLPGFLTSAFIATGGALEIRRERQFLPSVVHKGDWSPDVLRHAIEYCARELGGDIPLGRRAQRTGIEITRFHSYRRDPVVEAILPGWNPRSSVEFPLDLIQDEELKTNVVAGQVTWLIAWVNVGAESAEDLFFLDFEAAPEPLDLGL